MIIECQNCEAKVDAKVIAAHEESAEEGNYKICFLVCPVCQNSLLGVQEFFLTTADGEGAYSDATRVWPEPDAYLDWRLPDLVRNSIDEARKCLKGKAYSACAVMCGRVLESICSEHKTKNRFLAGGMRELLETGVIDKRIYEWGEELRKHRNIGAHATSERISVEDANDLLDFANAICDYVFILTNKFEAFMKRKDAVAKMKSRLEGGNKT